MKNKRERTKEAIIKQCIKGEITARDAGRRLDVSVRQVENLKKKYREGVSLLHGNCGRVSSKALDELLEQRVITEYEKVKELRPNFTHFHEILASKGIKLSYTAISKKWVREPQKTPQKEGQSA